MSNEVKDIIMGLFGVSLLIVALTPLIIYDLRHDGVPPWRDPLNRRIQRYRDKAETTRYNAQKIRWVAFFASLPLVPIVMVAASPFMHITAVLFIAGAIMLLPVYLILAIITDYENRLRKLKGVKHPRKLTEEEQRFQDAKEFIRGSRYP